MRLPVLAALALSSVGLLSAAIAATGFDGSYRGEVTLTRGDGSLCGKASYQVTYQVVNGQFSIVYDPSHHVGVNLQVQQDGSFSGSQSYFAGKRQSQLK